MASMNNKVKLINYLLCKNSVVVDANETPRSISNTQNARNVQNNTIARIKRYTIRQNMKFCWRVMLGFIHKPVFVLPMITSIFTIIGTLVVYFTAPKSPVPKCELNFKATTRNPIDYKYDPRSVAMGDFNNDTWLDIVVTNYAADNIAIYFGHGNGTVASPVQYSTGSGSAPRMVAVGDFDNDSRLDVVIANFGTNSVGVLLKFQNGSFASQTMLSVASSRPVWIHWRFQQRQTDGSCYRQLWHQQRRYNVWNW
ncbi:unnamed protein product [Rotaria sordida]|uniref:VCBS repeat-containing protein n=1 Tax=Rotaria sordida TaxID=392033 RepID=A0A815KZ99_9BILA|nr:unnamed protein product [Rotaria sordida]CAF1399876.1 unnamed protein product [Rotaria sordida]